MKNKLLVFVYIQITAFQFGSCNFDGDKMTRHQSVTKERELESLIFQGKNSKYNQKNISVDYKNQSNLKEGISNKLRETKKVKKHKNNKLLPGITPLSN